MLNLTRKNQVKTSLRLGNLIQYFPVLLVNCKLVQPLQEDEKATAVNVTNAYTVDSPFVIYPADVQNMYLCEQNDTAYYSQ